MEVKQDSVLIGWWLWDNRLFPVICIGFILVLSMKNHAIAQGKSMDTAQVAALENADKLDQQGKEQLAKAEYDAALVLYEQALQIRQQILGQNHSDTAKSMSNVAEVQFYKGDYKLALSLLERALTVREKYLGKNHPDTADSLHRIATIHHTKGDYARALSLYKQALAIHQNAPDSKPLDKAELISNIATLHTDRGDYERALPLFERALAIREETLGTYHHDVAKSLTEIATLYGDKGEYERALPIFERSLAIYEEVHDEYHPDIATLLNNLGLLHKVTGDYERALPLYEQALVIWEKSLGKHHHLVATALNNLAELYRAKGDYERALPLYKQSLAIGEKALGKHSEKVATSLNNLAGLYRNQGDHERALQLLDRSLAIREKVLGKNHLEVGTSLNNIAVIHHENGAHKIALPLYEHSLALRRKGLGAHHPLVAQSLNNLANLHWAQGNERQTINYLQQTMDAREAYIRLVGASDLSRSKRLLLTHYAYDIDAAISFALQCDQPQSQRLALMTLWSRKGRVLDSMSSAFAAVRHRLGSDGQKLLDAYRSNRTIYARQLLRGPGPISREQHQKNLKQLQQRAHELERLIATRSNEFGSQLRPVTIDAVQAALPAESVLVEWMRYRSYNPTGPKHTRLGTERYAASILTKTGDPLWLDLGTAESIDKVIKQWRAALARRLITAGELARQLDALVMAPVRAHLGTATHVFLSPDGPLNLVPFAALVDENGAYLVERYLFTYLTSGRDLLRIEDYQDATAQSPALIVADPQYDVPGVPAVWAIEPLPEVMAEAQFAKDMFPNATLLTGNQATEKAVKEARGPAILHLATHGYFAPMTCGEADTEVADPSLQSGVALAGANGCHSPGDGDDDGLLTALETASIDLYGTELAVLSACDTGIGDTELHDTFLDKDIGRGDGVQGLRRALVLAGAKTQMVSLWPVANRTTSKLMMDYYGKLAAGQGRSEALRAVQREFLADKELAHPNAWAAFIVSGASGPLPKTAQIPKTSRGPRGCACEMMPAPRSAWPGSLLLALLTLGLLYRMRRRSA